MAKRRGAGGGRQRDERQAAGPPRVVMEVLGHSTYHLTIDTYFHVTPSLLRDAADAMDRALATGRP